MGDGRRRKCRKCGSNNIQGPVYIKNEWPDPDRLRFTCECGAYFHTPTQEQTDRDLLKLRDNRGKFE